MFIVSTVNTSSASSNDVPVVVLTYGQESCLVEVPFAYEDLKNLTRRVFGIEDSSTSLTFRTSTLDICQGRSVRIHESAWESVRSFVAEIQAISDNQDNDKTRHITSAEAHQKPSSSKVLEAQGQFPSHEVPQDNEESDGIEYANLPEDKDEIEQLEALSSFAGSAGDSDDERESHGSERNLPNREVASEHPTDDEDDVASATADHIKTEPARSGRPSRLSEYIDRDLSDVGSILGPQTDGQSAERPIKEEHFSVRGLPATGSGDPIASSQSQTQHDVDEESPKYVISVAYRPTGEESMFKTRGTYSVKKVLARVCKTFELDFDRAHLKLIVEIEDEDGGELLSDCDNGDTMARVGAMENSRFIIVMDDVDDA